MKHTPGPWRYHHDKYEGDAILASNKPVKWVVRRSEDTDTGYDVVDIPNEADALLIAAAPELLDALENLVIGLSMGWDLEGLIQAANSAIAKAHGDT